MRESGRMVAANDFGKPREPFQSGTRQAQNTNPVQPPLEERSGSAFEPQRIYVVFCLRSWSYPKKQAHCLSPRIITSRKLRCRPLRLLHSCTTKTNRKLPGTINLMVLALP